MWFHVATLFVAHSVPAQNRPGPMHELSEGSMGGIAVHATHAIRSSGGKIGSPRGTTLVVKPLESVILILKHKTHNISSLSFNF